MTGLLVAGLVAVAVLVMVLPIGRLRVRRRLRRLPLARRTAGSRSDPADIAGKATGADNSAAAGTAARWSSARWLPADQPRLVAGLAGVAAALLVGGWPGVLAGTFVAAGLDQGLRRLTPAAVRRRRLAEAGELPLAADLLAVALRGGAPADRATAAVADALPGPLGERLARVSRLLALGAAPAEAWAELAPVAGASRLVRAAVRSAEHGSALAGALSRLADDLRADRAIAVDASARRAGVLIVLPLGLCFLPAFMLAGLAPVIIAVLGDVLETTG